MNIIIVLCTINDELVTKDKKSEENDMNYEGRIWKTKTTEKKKKKKNYTNEKK